MVITMTTHSNTSNLAFKEPAQLVAALRAAIERCAGKNMIQMHTFCGSGVVPDIVHGRSIATIVAKLPKRSSNILCCGQDQDKSLAQLKALMEFCERFACTDTTSNGYAAHTSKERAQYNAVLEVLERDAFMRFWFDPTCAVVLTHDADIALRVAALDQALQNAHVNSGSNVLVLQVPSQAKVPVALAIILAKDPTEAPALIMGAGAGATMQDAIEKALCELEGNVLNLIARHVHTPAWQEQVPSALTITCSEQQHTQFYHHPHVRSGLKFLDYLLEKQPVATSTIGDGPRDFDALSKILEIEITDVTSEMVQGLCHVVHATVAGCYPFAFGFPLPFEFECGQLSVARELPHPFP